VIEVRISRDAVEFWDDERMVYDIGAAAMGGDACIERWERHLENTKRWVSPEVLTTFRRLACKLMARRERARMFEADRLAVWRAVQ
jgi:hypothetical protein